MWYRKAGYSTELGLLKDYLKGGTDPYDYPQHVWRYLAEDDDEMEEPDDPWEHGQEWLDQATEDDHRGYADWLDNDNERGRDDMDDSYGSPAYNHMGFSRTLRPDWMVHFTDDAANIEENGFAYGHPDLEGVHLTTWKSKRQKGPGYNFAFEADSRDARNVASGDKYGKDAVVFYSGGIDTDHYGDQESQVVVWGPSVDKRMIFPIHRDSYSGDWTVTDYTGRELIAGKTYEQAVAFVKQNYPMLQATREKVRRRRQLRRV